MIMAQAKYKWNRDELNTCINKLNSEKETLKSNRQFLTNLRQEITTNWQSIAGTIYESKVDVDIKNYDKIIKGLEDRIDTLKKIANQYYKECEDNAGAKVREMAGNINLI
jgi:uncharacterized protein YukE